MEGAIFALETCYYGLGWRTRPGTLVVTDTEVIHQSYSWRDTFYAVFEPSARVALRLADIAHATLRRPSVARRLFHSLPDAFVRVVTRRGEVHDLILQRSGSEFCEALRRRGVSLADEGNAESGRPDGIAPARAPTPPGVRVRTGRFRLD
jgi:hypothetical protein